MKKIVVVGATSSIAKECIKLWAIKAPSKFILIVRELKKGLKIANDLKVRSPDSLIEVIQSEFLVPSKIQEIIDRVCKDDIPNHVLIAQGLLIDQTEAELCLDQCREMLEVNGISPALFAQGFAKKMEQVGVGTIGVIGSVAGDRVRKSNYIYGSAKSMIDGFVSGMQHRYFGSGIKMVLIKPGPTSTPMTMGMKNAPKNMANPKEVAIKIVDGMELGKPIVYAPSKWQLIMGIIKLLPTPIFNRINF